MSDDATTAITCTVLIGDRKPCGMRGVVAVYGPTPFHACATHARMVGVRGFDSGSNREQP